MKAARITFGWPHERVRLTLIAWIFLLASSAPCAYGQAASDSLRGTELSIALRIGDSLRTLDNLTIFSKEQLSRATGLEVVVGGANRDLSFKVVEFKLSSVVGDSFIEAASSGQSFTDEQKRFIRAAPSDAKIYLENILVVDSLGSIFRMPASVLIVR